MLLSGGACPSSALPFALDLVGRAAPGPPCAFDLFPSLRGTAGPVAIRPLALRRGGFQTRPSLPRYPIIYFLAARPGPKPLQSGSGLRIQGPDHRKSCPPSLQLFYGKNPPRAHSGETLQVTILSTGGALTATRGLFCAAAAGQSMDCRDGRSPKGRMTSLIPALISGPPKMLAAWVAVYPHLVRHLQTAPKRSRISQTSEFPIFVQLSLKIGPNSI